MNGSGRRELLAPIIVFVVSLATILGAWGFQIFGGFIPCELCLQERLPYYVGVPFALVALLAALAGAKPTIPRFFLLVAGIAFAFGIYLGTYHAGAEWGAWPGPTNCSGGTSLPTTTEDLMKSLSHARVVSCTEPAFRVPSAPWGLSFAGANALISLFLAACAFWGAFRSLGGEAEGVAVSQH